MANYNKVFGGKEVANSVMWGFIMLRVIEGEELLP